MTHPTDEALIEQMEAAMKQQAINEHGETYAVGSGDAHYGIPYVLRAKAALAIARKAIEAEMRGEWRDISTAPKDGTNILVWWPLQMHCPVVAHWADKWSNGLGWKFTGWGEPLETAPTHWQPLPLPPKEPV